MAQRILNSTIPFSMSTDRPVDKPLFYLDTSTTSGSTSTNVSEYLQKILSHGTAKHMGTDSLTTVNTSIIAQAECESQDSQEFCPNSSSTFPFAPGGPAQRRHRKQRRRRRGERKTAQERLTGVQDNGEVGECSSSSISVSCTRSGSNGATDSHSDRRSTESTCVQETVCPFYNSHHRAPPPNSALPNRPLPSPHYDQYEQELESLVPGEEDCTLAMTGLRNYVTHSERTYGPPFIKELVREVKFRQDEDEWQDSDTNEGILFTQALEANNHEYREGRDYDVCEVLKQGSYGEVYRIRDRKNGFVCAAKKMSLKGFSSEEVGTWSVLQHTHVVELFGFVREGQFIILFMDLKPGSLGQLLKDWGRLPEDLSLYYLHQVLGALEHLHRRHVLHLDVKVDNVLLSEDGRDTFLCDFGQSERLDQHGCSPFSGLKGTETHMAPEVVLGDAHSSKADVWSSCCMLLHMLNGRQPWTRYFSRPLYLKIAEEPPPLREIPPDCSRHTADVIRMGMQKEPSMRSSAEKLRVQTARALKELGGLQSPVRGGAFRDPVGKPDKSDSAPFSHSSVQQWMGPEYQWRGDAWLKSEVGVTDKEVEDHDDRQREEDQEEEDVERSNGSPPLYTEPTEQELHKLRMDLFINSLSQSHTAEQQEQILSSLGSECFSPRDSGDSGRWSVGPGDDLSSGVFSYNSQSVGQSFSKDWLGLTPQSPTRCFEGVDVCIRDFSGKCLRIRETARVKVGYVAVGISDQISESVFSLQCDDGSPVHHSEEVPEGGLLLRCVPAPDSPYGSCCRPPWNWRIRDGELETWN